MVVAIDVIAWFNLVRHRSCARCPGTYSQCCNEGGGVRSKNDRRAGTHFFELGGYKTEPLLTKMVNDDI